MNIKKHAAKIVRGARTNFYYAFLFLPQQKRDAIFSAYAFSRHTDDIVDDAESPDQAQKKLDAWREQLHACYNGTPTHPLAQSLQSILADFPIPQKHFLDLIDGVEMDLIQNRYATFEELRQYCYRVASVVGLICIEIFGYTHPQTQEYAVNMGLALQLTNILRDVHTDWQQNRIYIPTEDLKRFDYSEEDLATKNYNSAFINLMRFECERARSFYQTAEKLLPDQDRSRMFSAQIMGAIYSRLLKKIEDANFNIYDASIRLSNLHKFGIALQYWLGSHLLRGKHR